MRFWDSSAILPLVLEEPTSRLLARLARRAGPHLFWWGTPVECDSALARLERERRLDAAGFTAAQGFLEELLRDWSEIEPGEAVRVAARRLIRNHPLRAADALQLAAALVLADGWPDSVEFVSLDERLRTAAEREDLRVLPSPRRAKRRA